MPPDLFDTEYLAPDLRQRGFDFTLRRDVRPIDHRVCPRFRQGFSVDLVVRRQWQGVELHECAGHHVLGQPFQHMRAQGLQTGFFYAGTHGIPGHQTLVAHHHHRFANRRMLDQPRLDFSWFQT
ncbi:hypothetical protein PseAD21_19150 [Pseudomonas sp. AD21]|nr:hypothetical protein PseAD21_19150 [Pseudomonas sp. AD21]